MMHLNIWGFNRSTCKLSLIVKKLQQIEILLCGFHSKACCSIAWRYTSSEVAGKSLSHYCWWTLSTFEKLLDRKGIVFILAKTSSILSMAQISSSTIVKLQIARRHTWTPNPKMPLYLESTWKKSELKFFKL